MSAATNETARKLLNVTMLLMRSLAAHMRQCEPGLGPVHVGILAKIDEGSCTLSDLAQHQSVRLPTISKSITLLVQRGWVERSVPEADRRQTMLKLTRAGRNVLARVKQRAERHVGEMLEPLSAAERTRVDAALTSLTQALSERAACELEQGTA
jgi:DNA-binding MarR family transcriptional regulator